MPNRENCSMDDFRKALKTTPTGKIHARLIIIYQLLSGFKKKDLLKMKIFSEQTLNNWIRRFNESGIDGLYNKPRSGRPQAIDNKTRNLVADFLDDPAKCGETFWTGRKLHGYLKKELGVELGYSTLMTTLGRMGYVQKFPRSWPVKQDKELREAFQQRLEELLSSPKNEIWFADETGIQGDPRPRRRWVKKGEKSKLPYLGTHLRESVIGGVCPKSGEFLSIVVPFVKTDVFQIFLDEVNREIGDRKIIMVLDNATWHKAKKLDWGNIEPMYLPPYSPDFNPIERLWLVLKARFFTDWIARTQEQLTERVVKALRAFLNDSNQIKSICSIEN